MHFHNHRLWKKGGWWRRGGGVKIKILASHFLKALLKSFIRNSPKSLPFVCSHNFADRDIFPTAGTLPLELGSFSGTSQISRNQGVNLVPENFSSPQKLRVLGSSCCTADRFQLDGLFRQVAECGRTTWLCCGTGFILLLCTCVRLGC